MEYAVSDKTGRNGCEGMNPPVPAYNCFDGLSPLGTGLAVGGGGGNLCHITQEFAAPFFLFAHFYCLIAGRNALPPGGGAHGLYHAIQG